MMRSDAMFPQIDSLPCAQINLAVYNRNCQAGLGDNTADVRWHVIGPLGYVDKVRVVVRRDARHECFEINPHVRVGVLA